MFSPLPRSMQKRSIFFSPSIATKVQDLDRLFPTPCDGLLFVLPACSVFPQWCIFQPVRSTWNYPNGLSLCFKLNRDSLMWRTRFYKVRPLLPSPLTLALCTPLGNPFLWPQCWLLDSQFSLLESFSVCVSLTRWTRHLSSLFSSFLLQYLHLTSLKQASHPILLYLNTLFLLYHF